MMSQLCHPSRSGEEVEGATTGRRTTGGLADARRRCRLPSLRPKLVLDADEADESFVFAAAGLVTDLKNHEGEQDYSSLSSQQTCVCHNSTDLPHSLLCRDSDTRHTLQCALDDLRGWAGCGCGRSASGSGEHVEI